MRNYPEVVRILQAHGMTHTVQSTPMLLRSHQLTPVTTEMLTLLKTPLASDVAYGIGTMGW